jgi:hypothetical protein
MPGGRLVRVADVPRGRQDDVVCPGCRAPLVAKKGDVLRHHFAHVSEGSCSGAFETMLHLLGKQVIRDALTLRLPQIVARYRWEQGVIREARSFEADAAQTEVQVGPYRADLVVEGEGTRIAVEIFVTHRTTAEKIEAFAAMGLDAVEIDLSGMRSWEDLTNAPKFIMREAPRHWLHNSEAVEGGNRMRRAAEDRQRQQEEQARLLRERQEAERRAALAAEAERVRREQEATRARLAAEYAARPQPYMPGDPDPLRDGLLAGFYRHYRPATRPPGRSIYEETWT